MRRWLSFGICVLVAACNIVYERTHANEPSEVPRLANDAPFLKVHGVGGELWVLSEWTIDEDAKHIQGNGRGLDAKRNLVEEGRLTVRYDTVALLETNRPKRVIHSGFIVMGVVSTGVLTGTAICATNPKACFGSCPTFYRPDSSEILAEGFSASIARSLEATDIDALGGWMHEGGPAEVLMRNEALETHVVRHVDLLAVPTEEGAEVFRSGRTFFASSGIHAARSCRGERGPCQEEVRARDDHAYQSPSHPRDLAVKERLVLSLPRGKGNVGIVVRARNTLLNTFLFYQALAYFGPEAGARLASLDRADRDDPAVRRLRRFGELLADIEISVRTRGGRWARVGTYREVGPLAWETEVLPVPKALLGRLPDDEITVRLTMTRGYWKVDSIALAELGKPLEPQRLRPLRVATQQRDEDTLEVDEEALKHLLEVDGAIVTYPGDHVRLHYQVPPGKHTLFVESRGHYYEWMREEWLFEFDEEAGRALLMSPRRALKRLAPYYKAEEAKAEEIFWESRVR